MAKLVALEVLVQGRAAEQAEEAAKAVAATVRAAQGAAGWVEAAVVVAVRVSVVAVRVSVVAVMEVVEEAAAVAVALMAAVRTAAEGAC